MLRSTARNAYGKGLQRRRWTCRGLPSDLKTRRQRVCLVAQLAVAPVDSLVRDYERWCIRSDVRTAV